MLAWSVESKHYRRFPTVDPTGIKRVPLGRASLTLGWMCAFGLQQLIWNQFGWCFLGRGDSSGGQKGRTGGSDNVTAKTTTLGSFLNTFLMHFGSWERENGVWLLCQVISITSQICFFLWFWLKKQEMLERTKQSLGQIFFSMSLNLHPFRIADAEVRRC